MKKIFGLLGVFLGLALAICLGAALFLNPPSEVPPSSVFGYKLLTGFEYFIRYLPAIMMTGFVVSCSVYFGQNSTGSATRFSSAMFGRFKIIMIAVIAIAFILTLSTEVFGVLIARKKTSIINQPKLVNDYIKVGRSLVENGYYERAMRYADGALKLSPNSKEAAALMDEAEEAYNRNRNSDMRIKLYETVETAEKVDRVVIDAEQIAEVYRYYLKAKDYFDKGEWFNAHYYAEVGIGLATPKDPNLEELKKISTTSWNNLSEYHNMAKTESQQVFDQKYEGYLALVEKDDLRAYYIFNELYHSSRELQSDPDVVFYRQIAENRINERCFFIDETLELASFESANDVYFAYKYDDGSEDIVYFEGVTTIESTGNSIQYLRKLTVASIDNEGKLFRTMTVPYAKVLPVSVESFSPATKALLGIEEKVRFVPYIMLKSVSRDGPTAQNLPVYTYYQDAAENYPEYLIFPISYDDFLMLETSTQNPAVLPLTTLFRIMSRAVKYGFSAEVFDATFLNRVFYPLWMIIVFLLLATFAWNTRMDMNQYFKVWWTLAFPAFFFIAVAFYKMAMFVFKLLNYAVLASAGITGAIFGALGLYVVLLIACAVFFLARRSRI